MTGRLFGKVCLVTGAGRGIGAAYAARFIAEHAEVFGLDVCFPNQPPSEKSIVCDVTDRDAISAAVRGIVADAGRIDVVVNNAALYGSITLRPFTQIPEEEWEQCFAINVRGVWNVCCAVTPAMIEQRGGSIINISSNVVAMGKTGFLHYVASKGAVQAMTGALARELAGTGVRVNGIAPGYTITDATRGMSDPDTVKRLEAEILTAQSVKELIYPKDLLGAAVYFASDESRLVTGQTLIVDGGVIVG